MHTFNRFFDRNYQNIKDTAKITCLQKLYTLKFSKMSLKMIEKLPNVHSVLGYPM